MPEAEQPTKRITIDLPADLHEAFSTKCFLSKPRLRMNQVVLALVQQWVSEDKAPATEKSARKPRS